MASAANYPEIWGHAGRPRSRLRPIHGPLHAGTSCTSRGGPPITQQTWGLVISREDSHRGVSSSMRTEAPNFASRRASAMASLSELKRRRASRPSVGLKATIQPPFSRKFHFAHTRKVLTIDTVLPLPFAPRTFREERSGFSLATADLVAIPAGSAYVDWAPRIHPSRPRRWACGMGGRSFGSPGHLQFPSRIRTVTGEGSLRVNCSAKISAVRRVMQRRE